MSKALQMTSKGALGCLVKDIDLAQVSDEQLQQLKAAFAEHEVLFFENQSMAPEAHLALASRWGDININRFFTHVEGYPAIAQVVKEPQQQAILGVTGIQITPTISPSPWLYVTGAASASHRRRHALRFLHQGLCQPVHGHAADVAVVAGSAFVAPRLR